MWHILLSPGLIVVVITEAGYGETCISNDSCDVTNGDCYISNGDKTCRCLTNFYRNTDTNQCKTVSEFKPIIITTGLNEIASRSITVYWNRIQNQQFVTSLTVALDTFRSKINIDKAATSTRIDNLTPATMYTNLRVISLIATDRGLASVTSNSFSVTAKLESGSSCTPGLNDCVANLQCIDSQCQCPDTEYAFNNYCYPKVGYGEDCSNSSLACNVINGDCYENPTVNTTTCRCFMSYYRDTANNQCLLDNSSSTKDMTASLPMTTTTVLTGDIHQYNGIYLAIACGCLFIVSVLIIILLIVYFKRKLNLTPKSPKQPRYGDLAFHSTETNTAQDQSGYITVQYSI